MLPIFKFDENSKQFYVKKYILCEKNKLIHTEYLVKILENEFLISSMASEYVFIIMWDKNYKCVGFIEISKGFNNFSLFKFGTIFRGCIKFNAEHFSVAHNHPSGNLQASRADIDVTINLKKLGEILEITLLEHILIAKNKFKIIEI